VKFCSGQLPAAKQLLQSAALAIRWQVASARGHLFAFLEPDLDQAADGLATGHIFAASRDPCIDRRKFGRMPALPNLRSLASRRGASLFLCYHTFLCHETMVTRMQAEGKVSASLRL